MRDQICRECDEPKPLTADYYSRDTKSATGFRRICRICDSKRPRASSPKAKPATNYYHPQDDGSATFMSDKKVGTASLEEMVEWMAEGQRIHHQMSWSQKEANIDFGAIDHPILVVPISDWHWGSWATDALSILRMTTELLSVPNLYIAILGDMEQQAIKLRNVLEVMDNQLSPVAQHRFTELWLERVGPRVLFSTWDNHATMRQESAIGFSPYAEMMKRAVIWFSGIGHANVSVGSETYHIAVSHKFRGSSMNDPCYAQKRYMRYQANDREIAIQGDTHTPGRASYYDGPTHRLAINCGSLQTESGYAARHFSLFTIPVFPCFELYPHEHLFVDFESLAHWRAATRFVAEREEIAA